MHLNITIRVLNLNNLSVIILSIEFVLSYFRL